MTVTFASSGMRERYSSIDFARVRDFAELEALAVIAADRFAVSFVGLPKVSNLTESKKESISLMM